MERFPDSLIILGKGPGSGSMIGRSRLNGWRMQGRGDASEKHCFDRALEPFLDPDSAADLMMERIVANLPPSSAVVWIARIESPNSLTIVHQRGCITDLVPGLMVSCGHGATGAAYERNSLIRVDDYVSTQNITHQFDSIIQAERIQRMIAAPLRANGVVTGVVTLASRMDGTSSDVEAARFDGYAREMGLVLELARLAKFRAAHGAPSIGHVAPAREMSSLSRREWEVLAHVARGETTHEIGLRLHLSPTTVKSYLRQVTSKLGVRNRAEAIDVAHRRGLL